MPLRLFEPSATPRRLPRGPLIERTFEGLPPPCSIMERGSEIPILPTDSNLQVEPSRSRLSDISRKVLDRILGCLGRVRGR